MKKSALRIDLIRLSDPVAGLVPAIHAFGRRKEDVDTPAKPAHDFTSFRTKFEHDMFEAGNFPEQSRAQAGTDGSI